MQQQQRSSLIDIAELKAELVKTIGAEKSKQYFHYMDRFLSRNMSKSEFDKFCIRILGRDNLSLHNLFILSILKNSSNGNTPASLNEPDSTKSAIQNGFLGGSHTPHSTVRSNGVILPISPKKSRPRKLRDRSHHFSINSTSENTPHQSTSLSSVIVKENGFHSSSGRLSLYSKAPAEAVVVEDREVVVKANKLSVSKPQLIAPLGIPFCPASVGGSRRAFPVAFFSSDSVSYCDSGGKYDEETLRTRMECIAAAQGLEGVSLDCATLLNTMLDLYLKKLIKSCTDITGVRETSQKTQIQQKIVNGPIENFQDNKTPRSISLLDFKVAMELNPQQLGEDWPLLLEKICMRAFHG